MTSNSVVRESIDSVIRQVALEGDKQLAEDLGPDTVLLESGLDSLDFAVVVARLERQLGYDPFSLLDQPVYPRTFDDLVSIYVQNCPQIESS